MRRLLNVSLPPEPFNTAVRRGTVGETIDKILKAIEALPLSLAALVLAVGLRVLTARAF